MSIINVFEINKTAGLAGGLFCSYKGLLLVAHKHIEYNNFCTNCTVAIKITIHTHPYYFLIFNNLIFYTK